MFSPQEEPEGDLTGDFLLVTSGEFCDGTGRSRAAQARGLEETPPLADWEAWEREEKVEHQKAGQSYRQVPGPEVLQLLSEVPPGLRSRYCDRLRAEAQRRAQAAQAVPVPSRWRWRVLGVVLLASLVMRRHSAIAAIVLLQDRTELPLSSLSSLSSLPLHLEVRSDAWNAKVQAASQVQAASPKRDDGTWSPDGVCLNEISSAEDDAISLEVLSRRDILGYNQMLLAVHDWTANVQRAAVTSKIADCLDAESTKYLGLVQRLRASLLSSHARAARARGRLAIERQARLTLERSAA